MVYAGRTLYEGFVLPESPANEIVGYTADCLGVRRMRTIFGAILLISNFV
jgi:hypothetical protein